MQWQHEYHPLSNQDNRQLFHHLLENLPANADYDDIMEAIFVQQKIETGLNQCENSCFLIIKQNWMIGKRIRQGNCFKFPSMQ